MIMPPLNDESCLSLTLDEVRRRISESEAPAQPARIDSLDQLREQIRRRPQRDDLGDPSDGPRIPCDVSQRLRASAPDPNCVERSVDYVTQAEQIDPDTPRTLTTVTTPAGRHTFPVELRDGQWKPVVLDPYPMPPLTRNQLAAGIHRPGSLADPDVVDQAVIDWFAHLVENANPAGRAALFALATALVTGRLDPEGRDDLADALRAARRDAHLWGREGLDAFERVRQGLVRYTADLRNGVLSRVRQVVQEHGGKAVRTALVAQYGPAGGLVYDAFVQYTGAEPPRVAPPTKPEPSASSAGVGQGAPTESALRRSFGAFGSRTPRPASPGAQPSSSSARPPTSPAWRFALRVPNRAQRTTGE